MNPVLRREVLERFRTRRSPWFLFFWTIGIGLLGYVSYLVSQQVSTSILGRLLATEYMGRFLFQAMAILMMTSVILVIPGVTALSIVSERERQTLPLLQVTQLTPLQLVIGKLSSSMSYFLLLLVAVAPVIAIPLLFGGMSFGDVFAALAMMLATAIMLGSSSIAISSRAKSSRGAVAGSYAFAFVIGFITFALVLAELLLLRPSNQSLIPPRGREFYSSWLNPYVGMVDAIRVPLRSQTNFTFTPFVPIDALLYARQGSGQGLFLGGMPLLDGGVVAREMIAPPVNGDDGALIRMRRGPVWVRTLVLYAAITAVALLRAAQVVRTPARRILLYKRRSSAPA
ncbi:MAG TPA: ABC transporter permease subunit [Acidimicrobiia bacterium]|nr:ABC transporter permease subunit [Acidimicrobiia bacterium]